MEVRLKDFKPKYNMIEPVLTDVKCSHMLPIWKTRFSDLIKKYGECYVYSVRDYKDTKTTSICFGKDKPEEDMPYLSHTEPFKDGSGYSIVSDN